MRTDLVKRLEALEQRRATEDDRHRVTLLFDDEPSPVRAPGVKVIRLDFAS